MDVSISDIKKKGIKKPLTSFIIFLSEKRENLLKEQPELKFKDIPRIVSEMFKALSPEQRQHYDDLAKQDKIRYAREIELEKLNGNNIMDTQEKDSNLTLLLPVGRIRRILKLDDEVKQISKEAVATITKATELFLAYLGLRTMQTAFKRKGKVVRDSDISNTIRAYETLHFLRLDFPQEDFSRYKSNSDRFLASSSGPINPGITKKPNSNNNDSTPSIKSFFGNESLKDDVKDINCCDE